MNKIIILAFVTLVIFPGSVFAKNLQIGIAASTNVIEATAEVALQQPVGLICFGGGITHHDDDYSIGNALIALKTSRLMPEFRYGLGFKGVFGKVEEENGRFDDTLAAVGFWIGVDYELKPTANPINMPIELFSSICFAPDSLSFEDSSRYIEAKGGLKLWVIDSACIYLACRYTDIDFEASSHNDWERDDTVFLGGITIQL